MYSRGEIMVIRTYNIQLMMDEYCQSEQTSRFEHGSPRGRWTGAPDGQASVNRPIAM